MLVLLLCLLGAVFPRGKEPVVDEVKIVHESFPAALFFAPLNFFWIYFRLMVVAAIAADRR